MADLFFRHIQQSFYIPASNTVQEARSGYLLPKDEADPPATISLATSQREPGFYVFVPTLPQGDALKTFIDKARFYLTNEVHTNTRFAWFSHPTDSTFNATILLVKIENNHYYTVESIFITTASNILLRINGGNEITLDSDSDFLLTPAPETTNALYVTPQGSQDPQILPLATPLRLSLLGNGTTNGCFTFQVEVGQDWLNHLDIGLRLFYTDPYWGTLNSFRYPLFSEAGQSFPLYATLDPLNPMDATRSFFAFLASEPSQAGASPTPIPTYYRTILGHEVTLTAVDAQSCLVFAASSATPHTAYLVPSGNFLAGVTNAGSNLDDSNQQRLICGLSGVEYIILATDSAQQPLTQLAFTPGQPAFVKGFSPDSTEKQNSLQLTGDMTTSWVYAHRAGASTDPGQVVYCAQPDNSVLYKQNNSTSAQAVPLDPLTIVDNALVYMEVPSIYLPPPDSTPEAQATFAFPMLPYCNVQDDLASIGQIELALINPVRKGIINTLVRPPTGVSAKAQATQDDTQEGVTPQGLLAQYTSDYATLVKVVLAITEPSLAAPDSPSQLLLQDIQRDSDLWKALQSNQLFLVITDPASLQGHLAGIIRIQDWQFHLDPDKWRNDTVLIFKFFNNKPLHDLVQVPNLWTMAEQFNNNAVPQAMNIINKVLQCALNQCCGLPCDAPATGVPPDCLSAGKCPGSPDLEYFIYDVLLNPRWNGILALNVTVPPTDLPAQIQSLAAGIDQQQFFAHHVGINVSPVNLDPHTGTFALRKSSIFGLINYDDPVLLDTTSDYGFKVLDLKVLFQNSAITHFASRVDLQVNRLFQEISYLQDVAHGNLIFNGLYQNQDGHASYVFTNQATNLFRLNSPVLNSVTFTKGQFITITPASPTSELQSRFIFWGKIDFKALPGFDVFSFGSDEQAEGQLAFSNLTILMDSHLSMPGQPTFTFDASHLAFDIARSQARSTSLYGHFPLKLTAFTEITSGTLPTDLGYMSVTSPLTQSTLVYPWYGLTFELELGSLGALAEQAGFIANLLIAWSPAYGGDYKTFIGLKLPGSSGNQREITLQGLLKIKIKNIQFVAVPSKDTAGKDIVSYLLRLQTITLAFMSLSLPPSGRIDFLLFGDPNASDNKALGWYAVYDQGAKPRPKKPIAIPGLGNLPARPGGGSLQGNIIVEAQETILIPEASRSSGQPAIEGEH